MTTSEVIDACSRKTELPFLVIGGHAIIAHGYTRNTIDLLANGLDLRLDKWKQFFQKYGTLDLYEKVLHATRP